ncbi:MAG: transferrin receptor-like dimerization domain-containing protein [Gemmatimonadales bacterium]|nr:transferrin receptor-like dimerization domain-containing protein [Gemmatimonadales bacterium]
MKTPLTWLLPAVLVAIPTQDPAPIRGFSTEGARAQRTWEARFKSIPSPDSLRSYLRTLAARPQHLGSPYGKANAEWLVRTFSSWGLDARIETFEVLFPTPKERVLEMVAPTRFVAKLREPVVPGDKSSAQTAEQLPTYNAYSIDGDVTGPLVFVNYGVPADYEELARRGISVKGAIVIAKYGGSWRGIKPKVAAEHGAIGCLIYSDPADDGYGQGDVYPKGPYRPADGVQRGSVADMPLYPGDPGTPGVGSVPGTKALPLDQTATLTKIPVLPISYGDALPLLSSLDGEVVPPSWRGGLPITYKTGPGATRVRLKLAFDWKRVPLYNVMVTIPGTDAANEWVLRGNHRDGWVNGAEDPLSGLIAEMEELRAFSILLKEGWKPRRTIVYAAWDGEEQGLLGSTEYVETHRDELVAKAVMYLNTDSNGRGFLGMGGSHLLERFVNEVAREVTDPETGLSVWKRVQLAGIARGSGRARAEARNRADLRIEALGSGSDFTPFLQHAGIASLNLGFGGESGDGIYHSIYDNFEHFTRFNDTSFVYGRALAQTVGVAVMRMAGASLLPYQFGGMADTYGGYVEELKTLLAARRDEAVERNRQIDEGVFRAVTDPRSPRTAPDRLELPPHLNFAPLDNAMVALRTAADRYDAAVAAARLDGVAAGANETLLRVERALTSPEGLPRRPWYRHLIYAPGFYTGYGVKTMPGAREAIEQGYWDEADREIGRIAGRLAAAAGLIDQARAALVR